jgi:hypothetical protein
MTSARTACIFERNLQRGGSSMSTRVEACYRLAERLGLRVLDEFLAWDGATAAAGKPQALKAAVDECVRGNAALIVYSGDALSHDAEVRQWVAGALGGLELLTVVNEGES